MDEKTTLQLSSSLGQLQRCLGTWNSLTPANYVYNGTTISSSDISKIFQECIDQLADINDLQNVDIVLVAVHIQGIINTTTQLNNLIPPNNPNLAPAIVNIVNNLWGLKSTLAWILPFNGKHSALSTIKIKEIETKAKLIQSTVAGFEEITKARKEIQHIQAELASTTASAQVSAAKVTDDRALIENYLADLERLVAKQKDEIEKFQTAQKNIEATLTGASKLGLAKSFVIEHERLQKLVEKWERYAALGFGALFAAAIAETYVVTNFALAGQPVKNLLEYLPPLIPPVSAAVFFLWYAIRQRGIYRNLAEDYAFKEATAMQFIGYRNEMIEDEEMLKLLQEISIKNFGANPTRMLVKDEPGTPVHDAFNAETLEKFTKAFKELKDVFK